MSVRKLSVGEIQTVAALINNKDAIQILKSIRDNVTTEEDLKGKRKGNEGFNFIGFAHQDDVLGEDSESEEFQNKKGNLQKLIDAGLVLEGFHIGLEKKSQKKFGDVRIQNVDDKIGKYQLTEEGFALLAAATDGENNREGQSQPQPTEPKKQTKTAKFPQGESSKTNGNEIEDFKANINKELGRK
jgi:hypothetical protein